MCASRDRSLPSEILRQIFQSLVSKQDLKSCLLVCKSWQLAAHEYFNSDISIKVKEAMLRTLLDDLPYFGQNVKAITLRPYDCLYMDEYYKLSWKHILRLCPNITSICFLKSYSISPFLEDLQDPDIVLNNLQTIDVKGLVSYTLDIQNLYLQTCIQYRKTITSLQLNALKVEPTTIENDGLVNLVSQFPHLTRLKVRSFNTWNEADEGIENKLMLRVSIPAFSETNTMPSIDIKSLFEEAPQLNDVELDNCIITTNNWKDTNEVQSIEPTSLTKLTITADTITTSTFRYIVTLLKQVKFLHLNIRKITAHETVTEEEFAATLSDLKACTSNMEKVKIVYNYDEKDFYCDRGYLCLVDSDDDDYDYYDSDYYEDSDEYAYANDTTSYRDCIDEDYYYCSD